MKNNGISEDIYNGKPQRTKSQLDKVPIFQNVSRTSGSLESLGHINETKNKVRSCN
jgi:hypothetical protein